MRTYRAIRYVILVTVILVVTLVLNLLVAGAKLVTGLLSGSLSLTADGLDSLFDSAINVVGLVSLFVAAQAADEGHPYGHRKFETILALGVAGLLFVTSLEIVRSAIERLLHPQTPDVNEWGFVAVLFSIVAHTVVAAYEVRWGRQLQSDILVADATHTRADVFVSLAVLGGLVVTKLGFPIADTILAFGIALLIADMGKDLVRDHWPVLTDAAVVEPARVAAIVLGVDDVLGCGRIRSRGHPTHSFIDVQVVVSSDRSAAESDQVAQQVALRLRREVDGVQDVTVQVRPACLPASKERSSES
ncbi:MAG: cation diffusion facilitator family transporter [Chloroflexi bacterium]|nr:cation diffusion facilitator family transporter [Chloroflexota bacterium]